MSISLADITDEQLDRVYRAASFEVHRNNVPGSEATENAEVIVALVNAFRMLDRRDFNRAQAEGNLAIYANAWAKASSQVDAQRTAAQVLRDQLAMLTTAMRENQDAIDNAISSNQDLLSQLELAAGLVNPQTGERWDERVERIRSGLTPISLFSVKCE